MCSPPHTHIYIESESRGKTRLGFMHIALSESKMGKEVLDTFFLIHGAPLVLIDDTLPARTFLKSWREKILPQRPTSVLVISGHWETTEPSVNVPHVHETIHDFEDFPAEMYQVRNANSAIKIEGS